MLAKIIAFVIIFCLGFEQSGFAQVANTFDLSAAFLGMSSRERFRPVQLRSLVFDHGSRDFKMFLDKGDAGRQAMEATAGKLMEYFRTGVTLPDSAFWVNLRPDGENNVIDPLLEKTDLGKVLLAADLALKKDMAQMTSPAHSKGRVYWKKLYARAELLYGSKDVTIPTMTRPWIVPGEIIVRLSGESAYVYKAILKVQLEQDRLKNSRTYDFTDVRAKELNEYSTQLIRQLILPELTRKINSSRTYAELRQVYYSLILSQWFKRTFKGSRAQYAQTINSGNLEGLTSQSSWSKTGYFEAYRESFRKGEYNSSENGIGANGARIRTYTSGGVTIMPDLSAPAVITLDGGKGVIPSGIMAVTGALNGRMTGQYGKATTVDERFITRKDGGLKRYHIILSFYVGGLALVGISIGLHLPWIVAMVGVVLIPSGYIIVKIIEEYNWNQYKKESAAKYGKKTKRFNLEDFVITKPKKQPWPGDFELPYKSDGKDGGKISEKDRTEKAMMGLMTLGTAGLAAAIYGGVMHIPWILFPAAVFTLASFIGAIARFAISPDIDYDSKVVLPVGLGFACFATGLIAYNVPLVITGLAMMAGCKFIIDTIMKAHAKLVPSSAGRQWSYYGLGNDRLTDETAGKDGGKGRTKVRSLDAIFLTLWFSLNRKLSSHISQSMGPDPIVNNVEFDIMRGARITDFLNPRQRHMRNLESLSEKQLKLLRDQLARPVSLFSDKILLVAGSVIAAASLAAMVSAAWQAIALFMAGVYLVERGAALNREKNTVRGLRQDAVAFLDGMTPAQAVRAIDNGILDVPLEVKNGWTGEQLSAFLEGLSEPVRRQWVDSISSFGKMLGAVSIAGIIVSLGLASTIMPGIAPVVIYFLIPVSIGGACAWYGRGYEKEKKGAEERRSAALKKFRAADADRDGGRQTTGVVSQTVTGATTVGERESVTKDDLGGIDMNLHSTQIMLQQSNPGAGIPAGAASVSLSDLKQQWLEIRQEMARDAGKLPCDKMAAYVSACNTRQDTQTQLSEVAACLDKELKREEALVIPTDKEIISILNQLG